mgnify:CR=1 FL=1
MLETRTSKSNPNNKILAIEDDPEVLALYKSYLQKRGYEVLYLTDPVDEWAAQGLREFNGKPLVSALQADLKLQETAEEKREKEEKGPDVLFHAWLCRERRKRDAMVCVCTAMALKLVRAIAGTTCISKIAAVQPRQCRTRLTQCIRNGRVRKTVAHKKTPFVVAA